MTDIDIQIPIFRLGDYTATIYIGMIPIYLYDTDKQIYDTDITLTNRYHTDIPHIPHTDTDSWNLLHTDTDTYSYRFLAAIAALYRTMSLRRSGGRLVGL